MTWDTATLATISGATEIDLAARRTDGSVARFTTMWVVRVGDDLFVRSAYGPESVWYRRALRYGRGRIRAGGFEGDVALERVTPANSIHAAIDSAFHDKYDRYGPRIVGTVVGTDAAEVTLRLSQESSPS